MKITTVTIVEDQPGIPLRFQVHHTEDGQDVKDVTAQFEVHELSVNDGRGGIVQGFHFGQRVRAPDVDSADGMKLADDFEHCYGCGARHNTGAEL